VGKTKKVAGKNEAIVGVEIVVEPVVVQIPPLAIPVEVPHVAVAIRIQPDKYVKCRLRHCPLNTLRAVPMI